MLSQIPYSLHAKHQMQWLQIGPATVVNNIGPASNDLSILVAAALSLSDTFVVPAMAAC